MNKYTIISRISPLVLALCLLLSACGGQSGTGSGQTAGGTAAPSSDVSTPDPTMRPTPTPTPVPTPEPTPEPSAAGVYTLFAAEMYGYLIASEELEVASVLVLSEDGTGNMTMDEDSVEITEWTSDGDAFTLMMDDGDVTTGTVESGVILLDLWEGYTLYYAKEGTDTSSYSVLSLAEAQERYARENPAPDSLLYALWESLDAEVGVHLNYELYLESMDANQIYDVHCRDGVYYSSRTTQASGYESTTITFCRDGVAYNLFPSDHTGIIATEYGASFTDDLIRMDTLYSAISKRAGETDYTEEIREIGGTEYQAEIYPGGENQAESVFCFDGQGGLAYYLEGAQENAAFDLGVRVYTVHEINAAVDESLFDISAYTIDGQ